MDSTSNTPGNNPSKKYPRVGRPTNYKVRFCQDIVDYFQNTADFPTIPGFANSIGTHKQVLYRWADEHEEFSDSFRRAIDIAESRLTLGALTRKYDSGFSKLLMSNYHGVTEKQELKLDGKVNNNLSGGIEIRFVDSTSSQ